MKAARYCRNSFLAILFAVAVFGAPASARAFDKLPDSHPTYAAIKKVYLNVVRAFGDGRKPPRLYVKAAASKTGPKIAMYYPGTESFLSSRQSHQESAIVIDEKAFNLLQKEFGAERDSALAVLIGHELVHFYNKQGWVAEFGNAFADSSMGEKMAEKSQSDELLLYETEADQFGGFYAYLAGYDSLGMAPRVIDKIYDAFGLSSELSGYPDKEARKKIALQSQKGLSEMVPLFDTANRLLVIGRYAEAGRLFDYLAGTFPSREILNNAGVSRALAAVETFKAGELKFAFPFELDAETRLRPKLRTKGFGEDETARRKELLEQALRDFDAAITRDPEYAAAYVNRAAVYEMSDDHARAMLDAEKALQLAQLQQEETTAANAHIIRGIIMARQRSEEKAASDFSAAAPKAEALANLNLQALGKIPAKAKGFAAAKKKPAQLALEKIDGIDPDDLRPRSSASGAVITPLNPVTVERELSEALGEDNKIRILVKESPQWTGSAILTPEFSLYLLSTPPRYQGSSALGVKVGSTVDEVAGRYGEPPRVVPARQESYHVYPRHGIVFCLGADNLVSGWMLYRSGAP